MNSVIDLGWHQSEEGQGALAHLRDPITGTPKRIFGILEVRNMYFKYVTYILTMQCTQAQYMQLHTGSQGHPASWKIVNGYFRQKT